MIFWPQNLGAPEEVPLDLRAGAPARENGG